MYCRITDINAKRQKDIESSKPEDTEGPKQTADPDMKPSTLGQA